MSEIAFEVRLNEPFDAAIERVTGELAKEGFGVLTRINVHDAFKQKLGEEFRNYAILGACNPKIAHRALSHEAQVGLLLPCNVTVEDGGEGGSIVRVGNPQELMKAGRFENDPTMQQVATEAYVRLKRVAEALESVTV